MISSHQVYSAEILKECLKKTVRRILLKTDFKMSSDRIRYFCTTLYELFGVNKEYYEAL